MRTIREIVNIFHTLCVISEQEQHDSFDEGWYVIDEYHEEKQTKDTSLGNPLNNWKNVGMMPIYRNYLESGTTVGLEPTPKVSHDTH